MSPIHNLTNVPKAFMKIGKIKKGDRGGKNGAPRDLDYFRIVFQESPLSHLLEQKFLDVYGKEPRSINVRFAANDPAEIWDANYECYRKGALIAKVGTNASGPYWIYYRDPDSNETWVRDGQAVTSAGRDFMAKPIDIEAPVYHTREKNEPVYFHTYGRLQCVVPELTRIETEDGPRAVVGFMEFAPQSPIDIRNISAELAMYHEWAKDAGRTINGIPFKLIRREETVNVKIDGKIAAKKMWVVHLDSGGDWGRLAIETMERLALPEPVDYEDVIEADDIEFEPKTPPPAPEPRNEPKPVMTFNDAKQTLITHTNPKGKTIQRFAGELKDAQLEWVIANDKDQTAVEAAKIVLEDRKAEAAK